MRKDLDITKDALANQLVEVKVLSGGRESSGALLSTHHEEITSLRASIVASQTGESEFINPIPSIC